MRKMSKPLGKRIFDAIFSGFSRVDWHLDGWGGIWCAEKLEVERIEQGIIVGHKGDDTPHIIWAGYVDSGGMKCQLRVEAYLETIPLDDKWKTLVIKGCSSKPLESMGLRDQARIREAVGEEILNLCKSFGSVELDLGSREDIFFKVRSLEELTLKVDLFGEDVSDDED